MFLGSRPQEQMTASCTYADSNGFISQQPNSINNDGNFDEISLNFDMDAMLAKRDGPWTKEMVLCLDGEGITGLREALILRVLMEYIQQHEVEDGYTLNSACSPETAHYRWKQGSTKFKACDYFDYICGTSTGGLTAIMLGRLRFDMHETIQALEYICTSAAARRSKSRRFSRKASKVANSDGLRFAVREIVQGRSREVADVVFRSDPKLCRTFVLATEVSPKRGARRTHLFRSYSIESETNGAATNSDDDSNFVQIDEVCRATSATPRYFTSARVDSLESKKFRDGSMSSCNPALECYQEISSQHAGTENSIACFLTIGRRQRKLNAHQRPGYSLFRSSFANKHVDGNTEDTLRHQQDVDQEFKYYNFSGPSKRIENNGRWPVNNSSSSVLKRLEAAVQAYCEQDVVRQQLISCAKELVRRRRQRSTTPFWEVFAGVRYSCMLCAGEEPPQFQDREYFISHLERVHQAPPSDEKYYKEVQRIIREWCLLSVK